LLILGELWRGVLRACDPRAHVVATIRISLIEAIGLPPAGIYAATLAAVITLDEPLGIFERVTIALTPAGDIGPAETENSDSVCVGGVEPN
jgi:hypothetical protein